MKIVSGVYIIVNTINQKVYVGSSVNVFKRWNSHKRALGKGVHHCQPLQRAWNKYGEDTFEFRFIEPVKTNSKEDLIEAEQRWIDMYQASVSGYNILPNAYSHLGAKRSDESRKKLSKSLKAVFSTPEMRKKMSDIAKVRGLSEAFRKAKRGPISKTVLDRWRQERLAEYIITTPNGEEIQVKNIHEFCRENGLNEGSFNCVLHRQYRHYRGWRIRWASESSRDDGKPYVISKSYTCVSPSGDVYEVENLKEFCSVHGLARNTMAAVASESAPNKTHRGWICIKHEVLAMSDYTWNLDELYPEAVWERHYRETVASSAGITRTSKTRTRPKRTELLLVRKRQGDAPKVALSGQMALF